MALVFDINDLYDSYLDVKKVSGWKTQTQRYEENVLENLTRLCESLNSGTYKPMNPNTFLYKERGKERLLESYNIDDRIVQGCFVKKYLTPICTPKLIYDNSASLKHRGTNHFRNRLEKNLRSFSHNHGNNGYILIGDFTKFFDNIWHDTFIQSLKYCGCDDDIIEFTNLLLKQHEVDVSYMADDEYSSCMNTVFNSIEYHKMPKESKTGKKYMRKSVGIGSQIAQVAGVVSPMRIDNYVKIVRGIKYYGRFMDDFYIIHEDKELLKDLLSEIEKICNESGFIINKKKTQIVNLKHKFTMLKTQYRIKCNGYIVKVPDRSTFRRERRRMRKLKKKFANEEISKHKLDTIYNSWRGAIFKRFGNTRSLKNIDRIYENITKGETKNERTG